MSRYTTVIHVLFLKYMTVTMDHEPVLQVRAYYFNSPRNQTASCQY